MPNFQSLYGERQSREALEQRQKELKMGEQVKVNDLKVEHIQRVLADPDPLVNRLRGKYTTPVGERQFPTTPIQVAAAVEIDALRARAEQAERDRDVLAKRLEASERDACRELDIDPSVWKVGLPTPVLDALARAGEVKP